MIYIDNLIRYKPNQRTLYCHMMTDGEIEELHEFAQAIGLKKCWFQSHPAHPHYDISQRYRNKAIQNGAISVSGKELVVLCSYLFKGKRNGKKKNPVLTK